MIAIIVLVSLVLLVGLTIWADSTDDSPTVTALWAILLVGWAIIIVSLLLASCR